MRASGLFAFLALSISPSFQQDPPDIYLSCGDSKTCLGSTAVKNDPLSDGNSCLADKV